MIDAYGVLGPILRLFPPEVAHDLTLRALALGLAPPPRRRAHPRLATRAFGKDVASPLGIAAGFDKNGEVMGPMLDLGFGFVEIGTVTPRPQPGNPRPRSFRLPRERAVINRMGFNNDGLEALVGRLGRFRTGPHAAGVVAVNVGKNRDAADAVADYVTGAVAVAPFADAIVINVSSPNTPGLRALQGRGPLEELLGAVRAALARVPRRPPLFVKIAPDLTSEDRQDIAAVALAQELDGLVVSNTTIARPEGLSGRHRAETGGLSGPPLLAPSTELLREMYRLTGGRLAFIGVGGVTTGADAYAKIRAGASLVQLYTALVYGGAGLLVRIEDELERLLERDGFASVAEAVGAEHR